MQTMEDRIKRYQAKQDRKQESYRRRKAQERDDRLAIRLTQYGLTRERYEEILAAQNYACAVCERTDNLAIDHDHLCCPGKGSCGKCVRGLLCARCNTVLGRVGDDPKLLENLRAYLLDTVPGP